MTAEQGRYTQWTDQRLEKGIEKLEQVVQDDVDHFLEAIRYDMGILFQMCAERSRRHPLPKRRYFRKRWTSSRRERTR